MRSLFAQYLGNRDDGKPTRVAHTVANYNYLTEFTKSNGDVGHIVGFEALLYGHSVHDFPVDPWQSDVLDSGLDADYHAGGGFAIRHNSTNWEVREPWGRRYNPIDPMPLTTAVRTIATSPFNDGAFYFGGYDPNFFPVRDTAWIFRGEASAVWEEQVPCLGLNGCPHRVGESWSPSGCQMCRNWRTHTANTAFWYALEAPNSGGPSPMRCQGVLKYLNTAEGADFCEAAKDWEITKRCCAHQGCDICSNKPDKLFDPHALAGQIDESKLEYTCGQALQYTLSGEKYCDVARDEWQDKCCVRDLSESGDGASQFDR